MIIKKSKPAKSETDLRVSTMYHRSDVTKGIYLIMEMLDKSARYHDHDKISNIDDFYKDISTAFETHKWYDNHLKVNRHHLDDPKGVPEDVNLVDVIEHVVDCVMSGLARRGDFYDIELPNELLQKAVKNTAELVKSKVEVED